MVTVKLTCDFHYDDYRTGCTVKGSTLNILYEWIKISKYVRMYVCIYVSYDTVLTCKHNPIPGCGKLTKY